MSRYEPVENPDFGIFASLFGSVVTEQMFSTVDDRRVAFDEVDGIEISTVRMFDMPGYETAIWAQGDFRPVERYESEDDAESGHTRWVEAIPHLTEITDIGYPGLIEPSVWKLR